MILRCLLFAVLISLLAAGAANAGERCTYKILSSSGAPELKRGINLTRWWEDGQEKALTREEIRNLGRMGFDFVRLPFSIKWLTLEDADDRAEKLAQMRCDIVKLLAQNLTIVLDFHAPGTYQDKLRREPKKAARHLEEVWLSLTPVLDDLPPDRILLGLYNEPQFDNDTWWPIQEELVRNLRPAFPLHTFVVMSGPHGEPWNLAQKKPYDDKNIIYDFHFYEPLFLTHHGAPWFPEGDRNRKTVPIEYPVKPGDKAEDPDVKKYNQDDWSRRKLTVYIDGIAGWRKLWGGRIACLEFGVFRPYVNPGSRANWLRDMRELMEEANIPWALWEYRGGFGLLGDNGVPEPGIVKALGLKDYTVP